MPKSAVLITCHNRKEKTLACLSRIYSQKIPVDVYLVDDGSTDGTAAAISEKYGKTKIISGNGNLFWNRGMHLAWSTAAKKGYDHYFWLNDDTLPVDGAFGKMLAYSKELNNNCILCAAIKHPITGAFTYGAKDHHKKPILPNGQLQSGVKYINGNFTLIPKSVFDLLGNLDPIFHHDIGDFDYGLRAIKAGVDIFTTPEYLATCDANNRPIQKVRKPDTDILNRFKTLYSPLGYNPKLQFIYIKRHWGLWAAVVDFIKIHLVNLAGDRLWSLYQNFKTK